MLYLPHCLIRLLPQTVSLPLACAGFAAPATYPDGRHQTCTLASTSVSLHSDLESHFPRRIRALPHSVSVRFNHPAIQHDFTPPQWWITWLRTNNYRFTVYSQQLIYPSNGKLLLRPQTVTIMLSRQPKAVYCSNYSKCRYKRSGSMFKLRIISFCSFKL